MLDWLTSPSRLWPTLRSGPGLRRKAGDLYGRVVAAARQPRFYGPGRVADTPEGRFELVALHLFLTAERVKILRPKGEELAQALIEAFVVDMDDCMREMGVGDLTVAKRVKQAAAVFYERAGIYRAALAFGPSDGDRSKSDPLCDAIREIVLNAEADDNFVQALARYVRRSHDLMTAARDDQINGMDLPFANFS